MKTFLKVLLILIAVVVAIKLLPVALAFACGIAACAVIVALVGVSLAAGLLCAGLLLALLLSPIWLPVLALVGGIALIKKLNAKPATA
jgi:ABC-type transport system involved in cytochrome c biogenesis permease component